MWVVPTDASTIQSAIGLAAAGDTVDVEPGTYTGLGNKDIDFGGKRLLVRSQAGAAATIIDCQGSGRAFIFQNGEGNAATVDGFTITHGRTAQGGGVLCRAAAPTIVNCFLTMNRADESGGGVFSGTAARPRRPRAWPRLRR